MGVDDVFLPDGIFEEYNKKVKKQQEAQKSIIVWNPEDDIPKPNVVVNIPIPTVYDNPKLVDTVDIKIKNGILSSNNKMTVTSKTIEKSKRKYTKRQGLKVKIAQLSLDSEYPTKKYPDDACFDIYASQDVSISFGEVVKVSTGIAVQVPNGYVGKVFSRSGLASKGVFVVNAPGIIDSSYTGELFVILGCCSSNKDRTEQKYFIKKGDRIAQFSIEKVEKFDFQTVERKEFVNTDRGNKGIGSSGR